MLWKVLNLDYTRYSGDFNLIFMSTALTFRLAVKADVPDIVRMLADDIFGAGRERAGDVIPESYYIAFERICLDPNQELTVAEMDGKKVGTFQLSFIQYLNAQGVLRMQVEAVRTHAGYRGKGIGTQMFQYIINRAKEKGCDVVQLTSDKRRTEAIRFYERLGFNASHQGLKLKL